MVLILMQTYNTDHCDDTILGPGDSTNPHTPYDTNIEFQLLPLLLLPNAPPPHTYQQLQYYYYYYVDDDTMMIIELLELEERTAGSHSTSRG